MGCPMADVKSACTHCPGGEGQSCPRTDCALICPYAVEHDADVRTSRLGAEDFVLAADSPSGNGMPLLSDENLAPREALSGIDRSPLYIRNRVLLL